MLIAPRCGKICANTTLYGNTVLRVKTMSATLLLVLLGSAPIGDSKAEERVKKSSFVPAEAIKRVAPIYPESEEKSANAGMVDVLFMVDAGGAVFEPIITHSSKLEFENATLNAIKNYQFSPAKLHGKAIESSYDIRIMFSIENSKDKVTSNFADSYISAKKELGAELPDRTKVMKKIQVMERSKGLTPYSYGHLNLIRFLFANRFGSLNEQIEAIESMLLYEGRMGEKGKFLDEQLVRSVRNKLFVLNVQAQRYGAALRAHRKLTKIDPEAEKKHAETIKKIRESNEPVVIDLDIHPRGYTSFDLFKRIFFFGDIQGKLNKIKLRCRNKFAELPVQTESEYQIPASWGCCNFFPGGCT